MNWFSEENLFGTESIILKIGDLKSSDTLDTFGESIEFKEYQFEPLMDSTKNELLEVSTNLATGDSRKGVSIKNGDMEVFLIYGTNSVGAKNAQSMAIGYYDGMDYFFVKEDFLMREMNKERPNVRSRSIIKCKSLEIESPKDLERVLYDAYSPEMKKDLTTNNRMSLVGLTARLGCIDGSLTSDVLSNLRKSERFKNRKGESQADGGRSAKEQDNER